MVLLALMILVASVGFSASLVPLAAAAAATAPAAVSAATAAPVTTPGGFTSLAPSRLLDTRTGLGGATTVAPGGTVYLQVTGRGGVPASGVSAVVLNVTATAPTKAGYVTTYRDGTTRPGVSSLNFAAGQTVANLAVAAVGTNGKVALYNGSAGTVQLLADVSGYVTDTANPLMSTITNFNSAGAQVTKLDTDGNAIDAHDGDLKYFAGAYHLYGTSYGCGYRLQITGSPFCGFKSYSSVDLVNWTNDGFLFDASTPAWQTSCAPPHYGCYRPHVLYNALTGKYVLWINSYDTASGYHVLTATTPAGPFTEQAQPVLADMGTPGSYVNGDFTLFQDDDGSAYINYTFINVPTPAGQANHILRVQKLNSSYTSGVPGAVTSPGASGAEALSLFKKDSRYYMIYGPDCTYCGGTSTLYKSATAVLGTWSASTVLNSTSCGGQPSFVSKLPTASGGWTYAYGSDLWRTMAGVSTVRNQALANYYWAPLDVSGTAIAPFTCSDTVAFEKASSATGGPNLPANLDQSSGSANYRSRAGADISSTLSRGQSFTAGRSGILTSISVATFQQAGTSSESGPNAGLSLSIYNADANGAPTGTPLYTNAVPASSISWSPTSVVAVPNIAVTAGAGYVIVLATTSTTGSYGWEVSDDNPYIGGGALSKITSGAWTTETNRDLDFFTTVM